MKNFVVYDAYRQEYVDELEFLRLICSTSLLLGHELSRFDLCLSGAQGAGTSRNNC